jgi:hypothetical protein
MNKVLLSILFLSSLHCQAQRFISGHVLEESTQKPIAYVNITLSDGSGTATNEGGWFRIAMPENSNLLKIRVSCIGYYSKVFKADSLLGFNNESHRISLKQYVTELNEVKVESKKLTPKDIVLEAIHLIPKNYIQQPFNLDYYSRVATHDSIRIISLVETVSKCYRQAYGEGAQNFSEVYEKRVSGDNVLQNWDKKRKMNYFIFEMLPQFDIFLTDMIGVGKKFNYTVFNPDYLNRLEFKEIETTIVDSNPVIVIEYAEKYSGKEPHKTKLYGALYISANDLAIVKHVRRIGKNSLEILYKKQDGYYYPYFFKTIYPVNQDKNGNFKLKVVHEAYVKTITTENVVVISQTKEGWHLEDVPYRKEYWDKSYPMK